MVGRSLGVELQRLDGGERADITHTPGTGILLRRLSRRYLQGTVAQPHRQQISDRKPRQPTVRPGQQLPDHALPGREIIPDAGRQIQHRRSPHHTAARQRQLCGGELRPQRQVIIRAQHPGCHLDRAQLMCERHAVGDPQPARPLLPANPYQERMLLQMPAEFAGRELHESRQHLQVQRPPGRGKSTDLITSGRELAVHGKTVLRRRSQITAHHPVTLRSPRRCGKRGRRKTTPAGHVRQPP